MWETVWSEGVATLWTPADRPAVARYCKLLSDWVDLDPHRELRSRINAQIMKLEEHLMLLPGARMTKGIVVEADVDGNGLSDRRAGQRDARWPT